MKLSILDQSPIREGGTPRQAFQETLTLARKAEAMNYHRFWVSEHHNAHCLAGSGKPMARHGCLTQAEQEKSFHRGIGHAMNERAIASLAVPFATFD